MTNFKSSVDNGAIRTASRRRNITGAVVGGGLLLQQALGFVSGVFVARLLGPSLYGEVSVLRNILQLVLVMSPLGLDLALYRILPQFDAHSNARRIHFRNFRLIIFGFGFAFFGVGSAVVAPLLGRWVYDYENFTWYLTLTLLAVPFATEMSLITCFYRVKGRIIPIMLITNYLQPIVRTLANVITVLLGFGVAGVVLGTTGAYAFAYILTLLYWRLSTPRVGQEDGLKKKPVKFRQSWELFLGAPGMALNLLAYNITRTADLIIVGAILPAKAVGDYAIVTTVSQVVTFAAVALSQTLGPDIARYFRAGDSQAICTTLNRFIRLACILSSFVFGGVAIFGIHLGVLFGNEFQPDWLVVFFVPMGFLLSAIFAPTGYALTMCGHARIELAILVGGAVMLVATCTALGLMFGAAGAAFAVSGSFVIINVARLMAVKRLLGISLGRLADLLPPLIALGAAAFVQVLLVPNSPTLIQVAIGCCAYALAYFTLMSAIAFRPKSIGTPQNWNR